MTRATYCIISENTEDRFDETDSLDEALCIARGLANEGRAEDPVSIEHNGTIIHQFVRTANGVVDQALNREVEPQSLRGCGKDA